MLELKIYGTSTPSYQLAKEKLVEALDRARIQYTLEEVTNVADIIRDQVASVPAVRVNRTHLFEMKPNGQYNKSLRETIQRILQLDNYGCMKKIIVPTDFSDASFTAYNFANHMAHSMNATLFLTHIYHPVSTDISQFATVNEQVEEVHAQKLEGLVSSLNQDWIGSFITEPLVEGVFRVGFPRIELENLSHMENALMVMGTTGMGNPLKRMFGSLSLDMIRDVACPLFLIPPKATYQELKRILFMSESFSNDRSHLLYVARMASDLGLPLSVVHFSKKENDYPVTETIHVVKQYYPELDFLIDITDTTDLREAVNQVITGNSHHLVVFSTHHRNLIEEVFHRSISEFAALRSQCPLLILNEKVKEYIAQPAR